MEPEMYAVAGQGDLTSEDDSLPPPSGLTKSKLGNRNNAAPPTAAAAAKEADASKTVARAAQGRKNPAPASATTAARPPATKKAKKAKPASKAFSLIWVCHWGKCGGPGAQNRPWRKKDLKIVGIYTTKAAAEQARREVMQKYDNAGHGDILVGWKQDDEIDLIIRDAPLHM